LGTQQRALTPACQHRGIVRLAGDSDRIPAPLKLHQIMRLGVQAPSDDQIKLRPVRGLRDRDRIIKRSQCFLDATRITKRDPLVEPADRLMQGPLLRPLIPRHADPLFSGETHPELWHHPEIARRGRGSRPCACSRSAARCL
jgi:hypothetical protein